MSSITIDDMRLLRKKAKRLNQTVAADLRTFLRNDNPITFRRLPDSKDDPNVGTTCSCLMALSLTNRLNELYGTPFVRSTRRACQHVVKWRWKSSGLPCMNPFTTTLVLRTIGFLSERDLLVPGYAGIATHKDAKTGIRTLHETARDLAERAPASFSFDVSPERTKGKKPVAPSAIVYWFVDAVHRSGWSLSNKAWGKLCEYAYEEFARQKSYVVAEHAALMDPVAMAMAACLSARLRRIISTEHAKMGARTELLDHLHSVVELRHSITSAFMHQTRSGIWPKYFPLFNYAKPKDPAGGGSNYCFTFEMLEAVLNEFGDKPTYVLDEDRVFQGLEGAVGWCEKNRLEYAHGREVYRGWHSGGQIQSLAKGMPESWATAVVHMFLHELDTTMSLSIQRRLLERYKATLPATPAGKWEKFLDIALPARPGIVRSTNSVKKLLKAEILSHAMGHKHPRNLLQASMKGRLSALLFGPPGTSKTALARAVAEELAWPLIEIDPSHFLKDGLPNIYHRADEVFNDFMDMPRVVILFDEMDALVRTREAEEQAPLDIMSRFLTTSMLPKLARLHDQGRIVFLMSTNYQASFDPAIKRPGRFDLIVSMWPPNWSEKLSGVRSFLAENVSEAEVKRSTKLLASFYTRLSKENKEILALLTFDEFKSLLKEVSGTSILSDGLRKLKITGFVKQLEKWRMCMTLTREVREVKDGNRSPYDRYSSERDETRVQ